MSKIFLASGGIAAFVGVALGAFGAHALRGRLTAQLLHTWETAVQYHLVHALGLLAVGLALLHLGPSPALRWSGWLMLLGLVLFSGSLYALCLTGARVFGPITPIGGLAFLAAWILFVVAVLRA